MGTTQAQHEPNTGQHGPARANTGQHGHKGTTSKTHHRQGSPSYKATLARQAAATATSVSPGWKTYRVAHRALHATGTTRKPRVAYTKTKRTCTPSFVVIIIGIVLVLAFVLVVVAAVVVAGDVDSWRPVQITVRPLSTASMPGRWRPWRKKEPFFRPIVDR